MSDYPSDAEVEKWGEDWEAEPGCVPPFGSWIARRAADWARERHFLCGECGNFRGMAPCEKGCDEAGYRGPPTIADKPPATRETTHLLAVDKDPAHPRNPTSKSGPRTPPADVLAAENADLRRQFAALAEQCGPSCAEEIQRLRVRTEAAEARVAALEAELAEARRERDDARTVGLISARHHREAQATVERLTKALRGVAIAHFGPDGEGGCRLCSVIWRTADEEVHASDCALADTPPEPPAAGPSQTTETET